ncbi:MAG TPA: FHA domain-containing protein [Gaiellaceae bacterium]|nr:FHA domain-containing protein [Gaiellaceae bacterium]
MIAAQVAVEEALLLLKIAFLVLLYLFLWRIVRTASRDLRTPQESFVLAPQQARKPARRATGRLVAVVGDDGERGAEYEIDTAAVTVGRGNANDIPLDDEFASTLHARLEARPDGIWLEDVGSTNGTAVNGVLIDGPRKLSPGDVIRIGETDFRFER